MEVWDQLCLLLRARVVSVEDVSNKVRCRGALTLTLSSSVMRQHRPCV